MPDLIVIAGCNGAGKSTFSTTFLPNNLSSFENACHFGTIMRESALLILYSKK